MFGIDPMVVANETDPFVRQFRIEAHNAEVQRLNELHRKK